MSLYLDQACAQMHLHLQMPLHKFANASANAAFALACDSPVTAAFAFDSSAFALAFDSNAFD